MTESFNLVTEPWIKVINLEGREEMVSLKKAFKNASQYRALAGEMRIQNLSILRLMLAILTTVYTRFDAEGDVYDCLDVNDKMLVTDVDEDENIEFFNNLLETWDVLYHQKRFTPILDKYLKLWRNHFDLYGDKPFYQVTKEEYNQLVLDKNKITEKSKGNLKLKLWNRQISESNNKTAIFASRTGEFKNRTTQAEFVRWLITYQVFSGTSEKARMKAKKNGTYPLFAGWLYKINPVYVVGNTLFETLMLNLVFEDNRNQIKIQKPVWEYAKIEDYFKRLKNSSSPNNIAEIYTMPAKLLSVRWDKAVPTLFTASIPTFELENSFVEPMTTWRRKDDDIAVPGVNGDVTTEKMWRHFGQYIKTSGGDKYIPTVVKWLNTLQVEKMLPRNFQVNLETTILVSDRSAANVPNVEIHDELKASGEVLFDDGGQDWPIRIEGMIELTQSVGRAYWTFARDISDIRGLDKKNHQLTDKLSERFYDDLNQPFKKWLQSLSADDNRPKRELEWKKMLEEIVFSCAEEVMNSSSPRDVQGIVRDERILNIFTATNRLRRQVIKILDLKE